MKKIAIFCFSGTGNTYFVAEAIREALNQTSICDLYSIERHMKDADEIIERYDMIGLGYPIYGSTLPTIVFQWLDQLSKHSKPAFTFCTQLMFSGDGAAYGARQLSKKGFEVLWQEHFMMPNNITDIRLLDHRKAYNYHRIHKVAKRKAARFATRIMTKSSYRKGSNVISLLLGLIQRLPFEKMEKKGLSNSLKIDDFLCTRCHQCIALCPMKNLRLVDDHVIPQKHCTLCYRCVNHCPAQAINLATRQKVKYPYRGPKESFDIKQVQKDIVSK